MRKDILKSLEFLPFFSAMALLTISSISRNSLNQNIKRWEKNGLIVRLKNGLYVTQTFLDRNLQDGNYIEFVANKLAMPSYLSLEYVLQKRGLLTEMTFPVTSVTLKGTRRFTNKLANFVYHSIKEDLYFGFEKKMFGRNAIFIATPAKALFDYLYLRRFAINEKDISTLEELRINWQVLGKSDLAQFAGIVNKSGIKKMKGMLKTIKENFYGHSS